MQCAKTELEANKAYHVLMKILHLHPPRSSDVQDIYRKSLCIVEDSGVNEAETVQGADWVLVKECIRYAVITNFELQSNLVISLAYFELPLISK